jgi:Rps23 Pro-64 3,4-dihydroxylase Tpa1-like proline 4-hydroxylase
MGYTNRFGGPVQRCRRFVSSLALGDSSPRSLGSKWSPMATVAFFTEHCDRNMQRGSSRLISAVYYFHRHPKSFSGGILRIYPLAGRAKSRAFVEIEPVNDTLVFFPSWFPHEVLPVNCPSGKFEDSRFAINCWVHS